MDSTRARGFAIFVYFKEEKVFNKEKQTNIWQPYFSMAVTLIILFGSLEGPHIAGQHNLKRNSQRWGVDPTVLNNVIHTFVYDTPNEVNGHGSEENFQKCLKQGDHMSAEKKEAKYKTVMVKDTKRGNTILVNLNLFQYILY